MAFFAWRPRERDEIADAEASQADAEAEISKPLILPSRGVSRNEGGDEGNDGQDGDVPQGEEELPLLYKDEILRRRYRRHTIVTLAVGLAASVVVASVLFGLTYRLKVPLHIWMMCMQASENVLLVALPCIFLLCRFAGQHDTDDLLALRDRDAKVDRRTVFCMSGYEIGVGLYVLMEAHFHHQIGVKGLIDQEEFRSTLVVMAACGLASALVYLFQGLTAFYFATPLKSPSLRRGAACVLAATFLNAVAAVTLYTRLARWSSRVNRYGRDSFSEYSIIFAGSCLLVDGLFTFIQTAVRKRERRYPGAPTRHAVEEA